MAKQITFDILARDKASATFDKVGKHSDGLGGKLGSLGKAAAVGIGVGAVAGVAALGAAMVRGVKDAASYQDLQNKTTAVLKSTGNAAHTSVKQIQQHAAALESLSGVDEELIINSQNVMLTFTGIQNRVGKGNDIFNQATKAALNMSTALGTDLQGSTIQVGKALNDPIKGVTALQRVGVSFTESQKKQIKTLVESGRAMDAQKLILAELSKEFGGAAKAAGEGFNGSIARLKDLVGDTFRDLGQKLLPSVTKGVEKLTKFLYVFIGAITGQSEIGEFDGRLRKVNDTVLNMYYGFQRLTKWVKGDLFPAFDKARQTILPGLHQAMNLVSGGVGKSTVTWKQVGDVITQKIIPAFSVFMKYYLPYIALQIRIVIEAVKGLVKVVQFLYPVWRAVMDNLVKAFMFVVGGIIKGAAMAFGWVPGLGPKLKAAAANFETFRQQVNQALAGTASYKRINVSAPGASAVMQHLANIRWQIDHIPRSVTIGVANKLAGMRAAGGPIQAGRSYLVGERGPEIVTPTRDGFVHPNGSTPSGGGSSQPTVVQLVVDGKVLQQVLLGVKRRNGGVSLGLA